MVLDNIGMAKEVMCGDFSVESLGSGFHQSGAVPKAMVLV